MLLLTGLNANPWRSRISHLKEMLKTTSFGSQQNFSDSFLALCLPSPLSLPGAREEKVLGHPLCFSCLKQENMILELLSYVDQAVLARLTRQELRTA